MDFSEVTSDLHTTEQSTSEVHSCVLQCLLVEITCIRAISSCRVSFFFFTRATKIRNPECIWSVVQLSTVPWVGNIVAPVVQMTKLGKRDVSTVPEMIQLLRSWGRIWTQIVLPRDDLAWCIMLSQFPSYRNLNCYLGSHKIAQGNTQ